MIQGTTGADIVAHIGNRDDCVKAASFGISRGPYGVIKIARIARINGYDRQMAQVFAMVVRNGQFPYALCFAFSRLRHFKWNTEFMNSDQAETLWCKRIA